MAKTKDEPTTTEPTTDETTAPEQAAAPGPVTFEALAAPGQMFSCAGNTYVFTGGEFTTEDPVVVAFLDANPYAKRK